MNSKFVHNDSGELSSPEPDLHTCDSSAEWHDGIRPSDDDTNDHLRRQCPACRADDRLAARLAAWEDRPLDPDDDLALLAGYPRWAEELREAQQRMRRHPVFRVVDLIGGRARAGFLRAAVRGDLIDDAAADDYYVDDVCRCDYRGGMHLDVWVRIDRAGQPCAEVGSRADRAARCRWCVLLDVYREEKHAAVLAEVDEGFSALRNGRPESRAEKIRRRMNAVWGRHG